MRAIKKFMLLMTIFGLVMGGCSHNTQETTSEMTSQAETKKSGVEYPLSGCWTQTDNPSSQICFDGDSVTYSYEGAVDGAYLYRLDTVWVFGLDTVRADTDGCLLVIGGEKGLSYYVTGMTDSELALMGLTSLQPVVFIK